MALLIALIEKALEKTRIRAYRTYEKNPIDKLYVKGWVVRYVAFGILLIPVVLLNKLFILAPPLIVAFIEFTYVSGKCRTNTKKIFWLLFFAGVLGAAIRYLNVLFGVLLTVCAMIILVAVFIIFAVMGVSFPPVGAIALLPLIISETMLLQYPILITIGSAVVISLAYLLFNNKSSKYYN